MERTLERKLWEIYSSSQEEDEMVELLASEVGLRPQLVRLLYQRGIRSAEEARVYLSPERGDLHDPFLMLDMKSAVERMKRAIASDQEKIFVYADCDADGFSSASLLCSVLEEAYDIGDRLTYYVPGGEGGDYGVNRRGIDQAREWGANLIVLLDCGTKAMDELSYAQSLGMEAIICDHHTTGDCLPPSVAILNPKREGEIYPFRDLSGCGVTFKFAQALLRATGKEETIAFEYLELVALSVIADNVPMVGENRSLACLGLEKMRQAPILGLRELMAYYHIEGHKLDESVVTFKIAPLLNASGRMMQGEEAIRLLLSQDAEQARRQIGILRRCNEERRKRDREVQEEAEACIKRQGEKLSKRLIGLYAPHWYRGVLGVVAARLVDSYARPVVVMARQGRGKIVGSARSPRRIDIQRAFSCLEDMLSSYGGHPNAVGFSLEGEEQVDELLRRLEDVLSRGGEGAEGVPPLEVDMLLSAEEISADFAHDLKRLKPFGLDNRMPVFATYGLRDAGGSRVTGRNLNHLMLKMSDRYLGLSPISGMALGRADMIRPIRSHKLFDICYRFRQTDDGSARSFSLDIVDIRLS